MEIKNFTITKRDGSKDRFSLDKIMNAILKAFDSVEQPTDLGGWPESLFQVGLGPKAAVSIPHMGSRAPTGVSEPSLSHR